MTAKESDGSVRNGKEEWESRREKWKEKVRISREEKQREEKIETLSGKLKKFGRKREERERERVWGGDGGRGFASGLEKL